MLVNLILVQTVSLLILTCPSSWQWRYLKKHTFHHCLLGCKLSQWTLKSNGEVEYWEYWRCVVFEGSPKNKNKFLLWAKSWREERSTQYFLKETSLWLEITEHTTQVEKYNIMLPVTKITYIFSPNQKRHQHLFKNK
jgi:hypothetical protein